MSDSNPRVRDASATENSGAERPEAAARRLLEDKLQRWDIDPDRVLMRSAATGTFVVYRDVLDVVSEREGRIAWLRAELARLEGQVAQLRKMYDYADESALRLRPLESWHEGFAVGLFWAAPVEQPPYVGAPDDDGWPFDNSAQTIVWIPCPDPVTDGSEFVPAKVGGGS